MHRKCISQYSTEDDICLVGEKKIYRLEVETVCTENKAIPRAALVPSVPGHNGAVSPVVPCRCSWTSVGTWRSPTWRQQLKGLQSRGCSSPEPWETWRNIFSIFSQCYRHVGLGTGTHVPAWHHVELSGRPAKKRKENYYCNK